MRPPSLALVALALASSACSFTAQEHRSESYDIVAYDISSASIGRTETCPGGIGHVAVQSRRDETATFVATSDHPRVAFLASDGTEAASVSVEIGPRGHADLGVIVTCGTPEAIRGSIEYELSYPSGVGAGGSFAVSVRVE